MIVCVFSICGNKWRSALLYRTELDNPLHMTGGGLHVAMSHDVLANTALRGSMPLTTSYDCPSSTWNLMNSEKRNLIMEYQNRQPRDHLVGV